MNPITIIPMAIGIVAALFGMSKQKQGATWGQPLAILGAIIAIGSALWNVVGQATGGSTNAIADREQRYMFLQGKFLGQEIRKAVPAAKKVVVLVDAMTKYDIYGELLPEPREDFSLKGLKDGLGSGVDVVTVCQTIPKRKPQMQKMPDGSEMEMPITPTDFMQFRDLKGLEKDIKSADVFVALSMLPMDASLAQCLGFLKGTKVALLNPGADSDTLKKVFADGGKNIADVVAAVVTKKSAIYDDKIPSSDQAAFDRRYVLITKTGFEAAIDAADK